MARTETFYKMGFRMPWPEALEHTKGMLSPMEIGDMGNGTYFMMCSYFAATAEEIAAMGAKAKGGEISKEYRGYIKLIEAIVLADSDNIRIALTVPMDVLGE